MVEEGTELAVPSAITTGEKGMEKNELCTVCTQISLIILAISSKGVYLSNIYTRKGGSGPQPRLLTLGLLLAIITTHEVLL